MFWRISAAVVALTWFHGAGNVARDGSQIATELRNEAPRAVVAFCLEQPALCQKAMTQAAGLTLTEPARPSPTVKSRPTPEAEPEARPAFVPVASGEFPLPPLRPAVFPPRKGT